MKVGVLPLIDQDPPPNGDALWDKCVHWVFLEIFFSFCPDQQLCLDEAMTAKQCWNILVDLYQSASLRIIFRLTLEFSSLKQGSNPPAIQFITAVCNSASDLKYLIEDISDQKIRWQILGNLFSDFNALVTTLSNIDTHESPLCISFLREAMLREEWQISLRKHSIPMSPTQVGPTTIALSKQ